jgi:hypothetical protein
MISLTDELSQDQWGQGRAWAGSFIYDPSENRLYYDGRSTHPGLIDNYLGEKDWDDPALDDYVLGQVFVDREDDTKAFVSFFSDMKQNQDMKKLEANKHRAFELIRDKLIEMDPKLAASSPEFVWVDTSQDAQHGGGLPFLYDKLNNRVIIGTTDTYHTDLVMDFERLGLPPLSVDVFGRYNQKELKPSYKFLWRDLPPEVQTAIEAEVAKRYSKLAAAPRIVQHEAEDYEDNPHSTNDWANKRRPFIYDPEFETVHVGPPGTHHLPLAYHAGLDLYSQPSGFIVERNYPAFSEPSRYNKAGVHDLGYSDFATPDPVLHALAEQYNVPVMKEAAYSGPIGTVEYDPYEGLDHGGGVPILWNPHKMHAIVGENENHHSDIMGGIKEDEAEDYEPYRLDSSGQLVVYPDYTATSFDREESIQALVETLKANNVYQHVFPDGQTTPTFNEIWGLPEWRQIKVAAIYLRFISLDLHSISRRSRGRSCNCGRPFCTS